MDDIDAETALLTREEALERASELLRSLLGNRRPTGPSKAELLQEATVFVAYAAEARHNEESP